jgi:hypothetical protein
VVARISAASSGDISSATPLRIQIEPPRANRASARHVGVPTPRYLSGTSETDRRPRRHSPFNPWPPMRIAGPDGNVGMQCDATLNVASVGVEQLHASTMWVDQECNYSAPTLVVGGVRIGMIDTHIGVIGAHVVGATRT